MKNRNEWLKQDIIDESFSKLISNSTLSIVYSGLTIESFINFYGMKNNTEANWKKKYEKLSLFQKWNTIVKDINGKTFSVPCLNALRELIKARNELVHYKALGSDAKDFYNHLLGLESAPNFSYELLEKASQCIQTITLLFKELEIIDPKTSIADLSWDEDSELWYHLYSVDL
ncbi:hypothetical protein EHQ42_01880 [Leptospira levettii]|uniref:hypothetical protein n=1 Tax=Leptospira levettii TaxID=2023178 RepID=UPI001104B11A|nr:hypothetical protein [Leptospira levettii]TGL25381.1 hypothetical protein EHQ42_01880 [Leptospira levettii]